MNKRPLAIFVLLLLTVPLFSDLLPRERENTLRTEGRISRFSDTGAPLQWLPDSELCKTLSSINQGKAPLVTAEILGFEPYPNSIMDPPLDAALRRLFRFKSLEGLEYFSQSRGQNHVLFSEVSVTEGELPETFPVDLPYSASFILSINDLNFGKNLYSVTIAADQSGVSFSLENIDPLYYLFFRGLEPRALRFDLQIYPREDGYLYYSSCRADVSRILLLTPHLAASFSNRLDALLAWYNS